jgi:hypothetical protein
MNAPEPTEPKVQAMEPADRTLAQLADERARGDRAEAALAGERRRADALRDRLDALTAELREAQEAVEERADGAEASLAAEKQRADSLWGQAAQAELWRADDAARRAMSRWRRAWDGWRGR